MEVTVGFEPTQTPSQGKTLTPEDLRLIREEAEGSLYFFAKAILGYEDFVPHIHGPICTLLEQYESNPRLRILLPRGWFKTTLVSIAYPMWRVIRDPNITILIAQNTYKNALAKLAAIDNHFRKNGLFRALWPELLPDKSCTWRSDAMCVRRQSSVPEATFECAGVKTQVVSRHYDIIIEDDTVAPDLDELGEENLAPTKDDIEQAIGWHKLVTPLLVHPMKSQNIVVGTRWFERDLLSWVEENEPSFKSYVRAARETNGLPDEDGDPAWPERFSLDVLASIKAALGPYMYSCLYLNKPVVSADMTFRPEWFQYYDTEPQDTIRYTTVDLATDPEHLKGKVQDYNVVMTCSKSLITGCVFVLAYDRFRGNPGEVIDAVFKHVRLYKPIKVGVETVAYQQTMLYWLKEKMKDQNCWFQVEALTSRTSKAQRIIGLQPLVHAGVLKFKPWMKVLVSELTTFPHGAFDDLADCLSMQLKLWSLTRSLKERQPDQFEDPLSVDAAIRAMREKLEGDKTNPVADMLRPLSATVALSRIRSGNSRVGAFN